MRDSVLKKGIHLQENKAVAKGDLGAQKAFDQQIVDNAKGNIGVLS